MGSAFIHDSGDKFPIRLFEKWQDHSLYVLGWLSSIVWQLQLPVDIQCEKSQF